MDKGRERWVHEDQLINHRLGWLLVSQTILFAGYGFVLQNSDSSLDKAAAQSVASLKELLPWLGMITSLLVLVGVMGALLAMHQLKKQYPDETVDVTWWTTLMGWLCGAGLPMTFVIAWAFLL